MPIQEKKYPMVEGEHLNRSPNQPSLFIIPDGSRTYLWIGNDAKDDMACFGTISGAAQLRRIAHDIIKALGPS